jgi:ribosomal protein S18 acetylase RimI-like enzyme
MSPATQLEILDIRHFSGRQLRPLLEHEAVAWEKRLKWDYKSATELLLQYLDSRILPGFAALDRGRICGFTFCVYEGQKAVVGDAYAIPAIGSAPLEITRTLLTHLFELLLNTPNISRIESQLLLYDEGETTALFTRYGFSTYTRLFMECDLRAFAVGTDRRKSLQSAVFPAAVRVVPWRASVYQAAAELIYESYLGHIDSQINDQYRSLHGSLRFLHNIVRFPGCGIFDESASWLLLDASNGKLVGMVLCSRVAPRVTHITQLCVAPGFRGMGLARSLLRHAMLHLTNAGFDTITLTVTEMNDSAVRLYKDLFFDVRLRFDAMTLDKEPATTL